MNRHKTRARALAWACESLEGRLLLSTVTWTSNASGDWSDPSNWTDDTNAHRVPAADGSDSVVIDVPSQNIVVTYSGGSPIVLNNLFNSEILKISGGGASWTGGTWDGSGEVQIRSSLNITGSADKILKDGQSLENVGNTTLVGTGNIVGQVGASIVNDFGATFNIQSPANITFPTGQGDGIFENGGTVVKTGAGVSQIGGAQGFRFENSINELVIIPDSIPGDCKVQQGTLEVGDNQNTALTEGGTYEISSGATLDFSAGQHNIVVLRPPMGAPQDIPAITGAGTLEVSGTATVNFYGTITINEIDVLDSGSLFLNQNMDELATTPTQKTSDPSTDPPGTIGGTTSILTLSTTGSFGGNGAGTFPAPIADMPVTTEQRPALEVTNEFLWEGGTISGIGQLQVDHTANASITTTAAKGVSGGFTVNFFDEANWQDSGTITMNGGSIILIHSSATLFDHNDGTIVGGTGNDDDGTVWNMGNIVKSGGTGTTSFGSGIQFINDINPLNPPKNIVILQPTTAEGLDIGSSQLAKLSILTGTFALGGTSDNHDDILISPGATLSYTGGVHNNNTYIDSNDTINASILGHNGGIINFGNAVVVSDANSLIDVAQATFGGGTYTFNNTAPGGQVIQNGVFNGSTTGTIGGAGTLEVGPPGGSGSFVWNGGTFNGNGNGTSSLLLDQGSTLTIPSGDRHTTNSYSIVNKGTIRWTTSSGVLDVNGNYTQFSTGAFISTIVGAPPMVDHLNVSGVANIAGSLTLNLPSFTPADGQTYTIINNTGPSPIAGTFNGLAQGATITIGSIQFVVNYSGGDGNDLVLVATVFPSITIADPDPVAEGDSGTRDLIFTVSLSTIVAHNVSVDYTTASGTATSGVDFVATSGTLTIPAGQMTGTIAVPIIGDTIVEPNETFTVILSNPQHAQLGAQTVATGKILNDDGPPLILLSQSSYTFDVGTGVATITVVRTNISIPCTVDYSTSSGTAIAGTDFTAVSGTLSFASGVAVLTFEVPLIANTVPGSGKAFTVNLTNPQGGGSSIGIATATVNIVNDPNLPQISISDVTVTEAIAGTVNAVFNVSVSKAVAAGFSVEYRTVGATATSGVDFVAESGTLTFAPNQLSAQILVPVNSDFTQESTETFDVLLSNPSSGESFADAAAVGTILNQNVNTVTLDAQHPFKYIDARGNHASIMLTGPGTGIIDYLGLPSNDAKEVTLNETTSQSQLLFRSSGSQSFVYNVTVNGSIKAIDGPTVSLQGNLIVTGAMQRLHLNSLLGNNTITVGPGAGDIRSLNATFNRVTNSILTSALPLTLLKVSNWQDSSNGADITAPSITTLTSSGDFQGDVSLSGNLGNMNIGGKLDSSTILVGGSINSISASSISNSTIFAGVASDVTTLPSTNSQFINSSSTINHLTIRNGAPGSLSNTLTIINGPPGVFSNTLVAAPIIGTFQLGNVTVANNGSTFGIAGTSIRSVKGKNGTIFNLNNASLFSHPFSQGDLLIHLTLSSGD